MAGDTFVFGKKIPPGTSQDVCVEPQSAEQGQRDERGPLAAVGNTGELPLFEMKVLRQFSYMVSGDRTLDFRVIKRTGHLHDRTAYSACERFWRAMGLGKFALGPPGHWSGLVYGADHGGVRLGDADPTWCLESVTQRGVEDSHGNRGLLL